MKTKQIAYDIWVVTTEKDKYTGMIRLTGNYSAWKNGKCLGTALNLDEAEKLFEEESGSEA